MTYTIDAKTAKGQANQVLRAVNREARRLDLPETAIVRKIPTRRSDGPNVKRVTFWEVTWEDGPYEWAVIGGGGGNIWGEELGYKLYDRRLPATFEFAAHVHFDHNSSFDFTFSPPW